MKSSWVMLYFSLNFLARILNSFSVEISDVHTLEASLFEASCLKPFNPCKKEGNNKL